MEKLQMELTPKQKREMALLEVCASASSPISSITIAAKLNLKSDSIFLGRKIQHIIGDLVYSKKLKRTDLQVQIHGKTLPTYSLTESGNEYLVELVKHLRANPQPLNASFNIRKGNSTDVVVTNFKPDTKKPTLSEAKILSVPATSESLARVVPLPEKSAPKTPPYPAVGKPGLSSGVTEVKLRELVESMKLDGGKEAFLNVARICLENEQRLQRIELALNALTQVLSAGNTHK